MRNKEKENKKEEKPSKWKKGVSAIDGKTIFVIEHPRLDLREVFYLYAVPSGFSADGCRVEGTIRKVQVRFEV